MPSCAVKDCLNSYSEKPKQEDLMYHRFPANNADMCKKWLDLCKREKKINFNTARICSIHFLLTDYEEDKINITLGLPQKKRRNLKPSTIPSIFPNRIQSDCQQVGEFNTKEQQELERKEIIDQLLSENNDQNFSKIDYFTLYTKVLQDHQKLQQKIEKQKQEILNERQCVIKVFQRQHREIVRLKLLNTKSKSIVQSSSSSSRNTYLRKKKLTTGTVNKNSELSQEQSVNTEQNQDDNAASSSVSSQKENKTVEASTTATATLSPSPLVSSPHLVASTSAIKLPYKTGFSSCEQKLIDGAKRVNWDVETIIKNLRIRSISRKAYEMARSDHNVPRPSIKTLQNWLKRFSCEEGILTDVLKVLKDKSKDMGLISRLCVVMFDEMALDSRAVYDSSLDKIYQKSKAQVVIIQGLYSDFKQPIFYNFDTDISKSLLFSIITEIEKSGFLVCACVSDLGIENQALWKELKIKEGNVQFPNPVDSTRNVFVLADVPHSLKNMRNHIIDHGVILDDAEFSSDGKIIKPKTIIDKTTMLKLVENNGDEFGQINPHLTLQSLNISGPERMRVRPAAQFFSRKTSILAKNVFPENPSISEFFEIFNNGFDILNSRIPVDEENKMKSGFGSHLEIQKEALMKFRKLLYTMRFRTNSGNSRSSFIPSQRGFFLAIDAILLLFEELERLYGIEYILTSKIMQDILESFFSLVRSLGGPNTHPSPPLFRFRFRMIILGSQFKIPRGSNTEVKDSDFSFVSTELIRRNKLERKTLKNVQANINQDSTENEQSETEEEECTVNVEEESLRQLSMYLWPKLRKHYQLSVRNTNSNKSQTNLINSPVPEDFLANVKSCELLFSKLFPVYNNQNMSSSKISKRIIKIHDDLNLKFVHEFVRIRMRMKVKFMNDQKYENKMNRRNARKIKEFVRSANQKKVKKKSVSKTTVKSK